MPNKKGQDILYFLSRALAGSVLLRLLVGNEDRNHSHGCQGGQQKGRREPFPVDLAVYLVRRFNNPKLFQFPGELLVAQALPRHRLFYQSLRCLFPSAVGLCARSLPLERYVAHLYPFGPFWPMRLEREDFATDFRSYTTDTELAPLHGLCEQFF